MARIVNKYIVPDSEGYSDTRAGAIKRIQQVFAANREAIARTLQEHKDKVHPDYMPDDYSFFEGKVLDNLSERYGGKNKQLRVKDKKTNRWRDNDINVERAIDITLNNRVLTSYEEAGKRGFLKAIRNSNQRMYNYIKRNMATISIEHGYDDGIPLGDIWYSDTDEFQTYLIRTRDGRILKAVLEAKDDDSPEWHLYDMSKPLPGGGYTELTDIDF